VLYLSLHESTFGVAPRFVGLDNYARILTDPYFWRAMGNTVAVVLGVGHGELRLGIGIAVVLAGRIPLRKLALAALIAPYAVSEVGAVVMWRFAFDPEVGMPVPDMSRMLVGRGHWNGPFIRGKASDDRSAGMRLHFTIHRHHHLCHSPIPRDLTKRQDRWRECMVFCRVTPLLVPALRWPCCSATSSRSACSRRSGC
jgi:hypothetical protein